MMVIRNTLLSIFILNVSFLHAQTTVSTPEALEWINSKFSSFATESIITGKVEVNSDDEFVLIDVRGDATSARFFTLQKIKLTDIYAINLREESDHISIDIIPKEGKNVEVRGFIFEQSNITIAEIKRNLTESLFYFHEPGKLTKLQITLRHSSKNQDIGARMITAVKQILSNKNILLPEDKF